MDLKFQIDANFDKASQAFRDLANESESTREKIEKFSASFNAEQINKFVDKQKLLEASLTGTRGGVAAMTTAQKNYQHEIERLIKSGLDPESDSIQKLRSEHDSLTKKIKETNEVQKKQKELMKAAEKAALGMVAAIGAGITAIGVATQKTAEAGDQFAKTSRIIGMAAETFQELDYAAKMSGVDNLKDSLEKLNKSVADVKSGTGTLTAYLKNNDKQLLDQLKNVNSNEEAFNLLMDAIGKAPDEFSRAELAQAAFGKSGQQLILLANEGADGIANLREEARKYGIISNEAAENSEAYLDAQARLKAALAGVTNELTSGLLPGLTNSITKAADFIASINDLKGTLEVIGYVLAGVTAGLTAFLIVSKGSVIIHGLAGAFKALTSAMASNPIGTIAVLVTAVLIPALIALYKNWDTVQTYLQQGLARLQFAFKWLGSVIQEGLVVSFNAVKAAGAGLLDFIVGNIIRGVGNLLEVMGKLPFVGDLFEAASEKVKSFGGAIGNIAEEAKQTSLEAIQAAHDKQDASEKELLAALSAIDGEARARRAALKEQEKNNEEAVNDIAETQDEITKLKEEEQKKQNKTLQERLKEIPLSEQQTQNQQIEQFKTFLIQRMKLEQVDGKERIQWLEEQRTALLELDTLQSEEKLALKQAVDLMLLEEEQRNAESLIEILNQIPLAEQELENQRIAQLQQFLQQRADLENTSGISRIASYQKNLKQVLDIDVLSGKDRLAAEKAADKLIARERALSQSQVLGITADFFGSMSGLLDEFGSKNRGAAIASKALSAAQAAINSYLAFTQVLSNPLEGPSWIRIFAAGTVLATGLAQQIRILSTPIPSAETGGRFIVPHSVGSDSTLMKVNSDEEVEITPRGMAGGGNGQTITVQIEKQTIFDVVNDGLRSGDILIAAVNF